MIQCITIHTYACIYLSLKVLDLLYLLVKYGYYADMEDIKVLMPPLISLLNGKNDKPYLEANASETSKFTNVRMYVLCINICLSNALQSQGERYIDNQENRAIFKMKIKALKVMNLFFNFRLYLRLQVWDTITIFISSVSFHFFSTSSMTTNY